MSSGTLSGTITNAVLSGIESALPVELVSFLASVHGMNAVLQWKTAGEVDCAGFEIERRFVEALFTVNGPEENVSNLIQSPGQRWIPVGFVPGSGTSYIMHEYKFVDHNLMNGRYAYRLKQLNQDGTFKYSHQVEVELGSAPKAFSLSKNYPNPFNPITEIKFQIPLSPFSDKREQEVFVRLKVYDILGKEVATLVNEMKEAGIYTVQWNAIGFPSGIYFYRLESGGESKTERMLLLK